MAENMDKELTLKFVEDYKNFACLWNTNLTTYRNTSVRNEALRTLDRKYELGGIMAVKNKIKSLRSYFAKEHGKYIRRSRRNGAEKPYVPSWFAYRHLLFLKDTYTLETLRNMKNMKKGARHFVDAEQELPYEAVNDDDGDDVDAVETPTPSDSLASETLPSNHKKRKSKETHPEELREEKKPYRFVKNIASGANWSDEYTAFGDYIGHKIRNLPTSQLRSIAQHRIANILFDLEMSPASKHPVVYSTSSSSCGDTDPPTPPSQIHIVDSGSEQD